MGKKIKTIYYQTVTNYYGQGQWAGEVTKRTIVYFSGQVRDTFVTIDKKKPAGQKIHPPEQESLRLKTVTVLHPGPSGYGNVPADG